MLPEEKAIDRIRLVWAEIDEAQLIALKSYFSFLRDFDQHISEDSPYELYESRWGILGIISRAYQLTLCSAEQVADKNLNGFYGSARALIESLCSIVWVNEKPDRVISLVQTSPIKAGKILNAGYRKYDCLKDMYSKMSQFVHPNRSSHLLGIRPQEEQAEKGGFGPFALDFSSWFAKTMMNELHFICGNIKEELEELITVDQITRKGRVMAQLVSRQEE